MCKSLEEASFSLFLHFLFSVFPFPAFSLFASALPRALPRGVLAYQAWRIRNHEYVLIILKKKKNHERTSKRLFTSKMGHSLQKS